MSLVVRQRGLRLLIPRNKLIRGVIAGGPGELAALPLLQPRDHPNAVPSFERVGYLPELLLELGQGVVVGRDGAVGKTGRGQLTEVNHVRASVQSGRLGRRTGSRFCLSDQRCTMAKGSSPS